MATVEHDPVTCGLGAKYCPGCRADPPEPEGVPWGATLTRDYRRILARWEELHVADVPGLPRQDREALAGEKARTFDAAAVVRAQGVNDLLTLLRWTTADAPGALGQFLGAVVRDAVGPDLGELVGAVARIELELKTVVDALAAIERRVEALGG